MWKPIQGFEGLYEVSDGGRVRTLRGKTPRILNINKTVAGYPHVGLVKKGESAKKRHWYSVHRLVAAAFIGPCPEGYVVNHKDENKANNAVSNLEYVTRLENNTFGSRIDRIANLTRKPVVRIGKDGGLKIYKWAGDAAKELGCSISCIQRAALGLAKTAKGYYWKYASTKEVR